MESYGYPYSFPRPEEYPDHGDGATYYGKTPGNDLKSKRSSRSKRHYKDKKTASRSASNSLSRSRSRSEHSHSVTESIRSLSAESKRQSLNQPGFWDAFRVLYLKPSNHKKNTTKYLATKKKQDRIQEILKSDGLGSKKWLFYPRRHTEPTVEAIDNCDKRVKVDGDFFRKYKKKKHVDSDAPIAKLKRWELILYKKFGFVQAVY